MQAKTPKIFIWAFLIYDSLSLILVRTDDMFHQEARQQPITGYFATLELGSFCFAGLFASRFFLRSFINQFHI